MDRKFGLLDAFKQYVKDAMPGGLLSAEWTPERTSKAAGLLADVTPVVGGIKGAREEWDAGNPGWAAVNAATVPLDLMSFGTGGVALKGLAGAIVLGKDGWRMAKQPFGYVGGHAKDGVLRIETSQIDEAVRGQGKGVELYRELIDDALKRGETVVSDNTVEIPAARVYESLKRKGYAVEDLPRGELPADADLTHGAYYGLNNGPVFKITGGPSPKSYDISQSQKAVTDNVSLLGSAPDQFSPFTYLMTGNQSDRLAKIQSGKNGPMPDNFGIEVSQANNLEHPFDSRSIKDGMPQEQTAGLLGSVYHNQSQIGSPLGQPKSFAMVNTKQKVDGKVPVGIFSIQDGKIVFETAYPASSMKADSLLKKK